MKLATSRKMWWSRNGPRPKKSWKRSSTTATSWVRTTKTAFAIREHTHMTPSHKRNGDGKKLAFSTFRWSDESDVIRRERKFKFK